MLQESPEFASVVPSIMKCPLPLAFWSGYTRSCLVSAHFLGEYAVWLPGDETTTATDSEPESDPRLVMPRRWVDLQGKTIFSTWKAALRAVVGLLLTRPLVNHVRRPLISDAFPRGQFH